MDHHHIDKISEAIEFIETHLNEKLSLDRVAAAVHYSKYHLHRVFTDMVGLTLHEYGKRRQMTEAAKQLVFSAKPIVEIAIAAGYESQQAFTNTFTAMYKQSPNRYREKEEFYPLQLRFRLEGNYRMLQSKEIGKSEITFAGQESIGCWMDLVRLTIDGYPHLHEEEYIQELKRRISDREALILKDGEIAAGVMMFSYETGSIDFMGTHPLYRKMGIPRAFLQKVMGELVKDKALTITTYREGDRADTGYRREIVELGFAEAELLVEFGYPTQRFILPRVTGGSEEVPFPEEVEHLAQIGETLEAAFLEAEAGLNRIDREYMDAKRYMADYRGELDPHEMFQNELALKQIDRTGAFAVGIWQRLAKLKESPYFARIDFQARGEEGEEVYYIGRFAFQYGNKPLIYDWRAPVAGMFYDCEVGPAGYDAPAGKVEGELTRKRQFKVSHGRLEYALETSVNIRDDVLSRELSKTSDEKMKSIISTIQREQNQIIRNEKAGTILIQGVAGSGKTSIALHRVAFLLYRFKGKLSARNVTILSPNKVFGDYISTVLPELGEEPIYELSFREIAEIQLDGSLRFEPEPDPLEREEGGWADRLRFKSTLNFVRDMDRYLEEAPALVFQPTDYVSGTFAVTADWIRSRFLAYTAAPIKKRLELVAADIRDRFDADSWRGDEIPRPGAILKSLRTMMRIKTTLALYRDFYGWLKRPDMLFLPDRQTLEWADVYPFVYFKAAFEGIQESRLTKHLVIDEMQDYTPIQYAVINRIFPCPKTILGDFGQFVNPYHSHTLADMRELYRDGNLVELKKSYRSTYEIITFAGGIQPVSGLEPVKRHGEFPLLLACRDQTEQLAKIRERLETFEGGQAVSLGIILKTNAAARNLYDRLAGDYEIRLISPDSDSFVNGISVTSVRMAKGLEFDEVLIPDADGGTYQTEYDRSLLYIAVTRAMHRLALFYTGEPSHFLPR